MNKPKYLYKAEEDLLVYRFVNEVVKGKIKKVIIYIFLYRNRKYL